MKTRQKIIKESLFLFNQTTFESSTTSLIAEKSEVLEGSLWYHFNSKNDLVSTHLEMFDEEFHLRQKDSVSEDPKTLILGLFSAYEIFWDYRYLMRDSFEQVSRDLPALYSKIVEANSYVDEWAQTMILRARDIGVLLINDEDVESIVEISLIISRHWLDYSMKKYPNDSPPHLRKKGINLLIKSLYPYLSLESKEIIEEFTSSAR